MHVCVIFDSESCIAAWGMIKDTDSFSLYDKTTKYEGKVASNEMLMTTTAELVNHCSADKCIYFLLYKEWADVTVCSTVCLYRVSSQSSGSDLEVHKNI